MLLVSPMTLLRRDSSLSGKTALLNNLKLVKYNEGKIVLTLMFEGSK